MRTFPSPGRNIVVLGIAGQIDSANEMTLKQALASALRRRPRDLVIDMSATVFAGTHALALIGDTAAACATSQTRVAVSGLSGVQRRATSLLWDPGSPTRYRSVAAAVATINAGTINAGRPIGQLRPAGPLTYSSGAAGNAPEDVGAALRAVLAAVVFPARRWELLAEAEYYGADYYTRARLHRLPETVYPDLAAVVATVTAADRQSPRVRRQPR